MLWSIFCSEVGISKSGFYARVHSIGADPRRKGAVRVLITGQYMEASILLLDPEVPPMEKGPAAYSTLPLLINLLEI